MKYLSEELKDFKWEELSNEKHYGVFAETGAGKTTFFLSDFVEKIGEKKLLYLCNRKSVLEQLEFYKRDNVEIILYHKLENMKSKDEVESYLKDFDFIVCDEAHYWFTDHFNYKNFFSFREINEFKGIVFFVTGTPKYVLDMRKFMSKPLEILREVNHENNNVRSIYIFKSKKFIGEYTCMRLEKSERIINFSQYPNNLIEMREKYKAYSSAFLCSKDNSLYIIADIDVEKELRKDKNEKGEAIDNLTPKWLGLTSAFENGCNFNTTGVTSVIFQNYISFTSLEQSRSRVRNYNGAVIDLVVYVPKNKEIQKNLLKLECEIEEIEERRELFYTEYGKEIDKVFQSQKKSIFKIGFNNTEFEEYQYNEIRLNALKIKQKEIQLLLAAGNEKELFYQDKLNKMYPSSQVVIGNRGHVIDYDEIFENFLKGNKEELLVYERLINFKEEIGSLKINLKHGGSVVGLHTIKKYLKETNSKYQIKSESIYDPKTQGKNTGWFVYYFEDN